MDKNTKQKYLSQQSTEQLMKSMRWLQLPAVRQGRVYFVLELERCHDPAKLLTALPKLLGTSS
ncbi:hypothetical protein [Paenibacillus polymyxa]|uniref:hypothetical protein n=1 Tax=Paenibacillus polymyxa TaxID=1406 RepID=UPI002378C2A4|nr:hypothetical protein [Paenibacillus polymyxa]